VRIIEHVALALHAAHKVGLVHRDVKPSNILLDDNDFAYLIDFGIARAADETRLTKSGNMIGTFLYIAPERLGARGEEDARADIYSLACVLYECLTGRPPFAEDTMAGLVAAHLNTPPQPSTTQPNVPEQIDQVIATGMAKDPDNRYATTVELADAARDAITVPIQRPTPSPAPNPPTQQAPATEPTLLDQPVPPTLLNDQVPPTPASEAVWQQPADLHLAATQQRPPGWPPVPQTRPADRPPDIGTPRSSWWDRLPQGAKLTLIVSIVMIVAAAGISGYLVWPHPPQTQTSQSAPPYAQSAPPSGQSAQPAPSAYRSESMISCSVCGCPTLRLFPVPV
jgi:serine/threonine-protein kinase